MPILALCYRRQGEAEERVLGEAVLVARLDEVATVRGFCCVWNYIWEAVGFRTKERFHAISSRKWRSWRVETLDLKRG